MNHSGTTFLDLNDLLNDGSIFLSAGQQLAITEKNNQPGEWTLTGIIVPAAGAELLSQPEFTAHTHLEAQPEGTTLKGLIKAGDKAGTVDGVTITLTNASIAGEPTKTHTFSVDIRETLVARPS
jgi:hypothetical protein